MAQGQQSGGGRDRTYISRDEFEVFERNVDRSFINVTDALNALTGKIDRMGSTDWKTFGMFAGLILSIVTLAASPFLRDLGRLERNQEQLRSTASSVTGDRWTEDDQRRFEGEVEADLRRLEEGAKGSRDELEARLRATEIELAKRGAIIESLEQARLSGE